MVHESEIQRIVGIFMENGFKGGVEEARRIASEILDPQKHHDPPTVFESIPQKAWDMAAEFQKEHPEASLDELVKIVLGDTRVPVT